MEIPEKDLNDECAIVLYDRQHFPDAHVVSGLVKDYTFASSI